MKLIEHIMSALNVYVVEAETLIIKGKVYVDGIQRTDPDLPINEPAQIRVSGYGHFWVTNSEVNL